MILILFIRNDYASKDELGNEEVNVDDSTEWIYPSVDLSTRLTVNSFEALMAKKSLQVLLNRSQKEI